MYQKFLHTAATHRMYVITLMYFTLQNRVDQMILDFIEPFPFLSSTVVFAQIYVLKDLTIFVFIKIVEIFNHKYTGLLLQKFHMTNTQSDMHFIFHHLQYLSDIPDSCYSGYTKDDNGHPPTKGELCTGNFKK